VIVVQAIADQAELFRTNTGICNLL